MSKTNYNIQNYIDLVRSGKFRICEEQLQLCRLIESIFKEEDLYINEKQLEKYLSYQKYFPFRLLEWEKFCFTLHNCVYKKDGQLRFPVLFIYVGRGAGKNGYLAFEDFCLLTPTNGVKHYNIDIFAMSEEQAKTSFYDVYNVLEENKTIMKKFFQWNKERIVNLKTKSEFAFRTSSSKTKDGMRPGKVDFDEYHAYPNMKLVDVATTGLGKVAYPRRTIVTTDGDVRGGPLDSLLEKSFLILNREMADNGMLPFLCRIKEKEEIKDKKNWTMANPSLFYFPTLRQQIEGEFADYLMDPIGNASFATKRMNCPVGDVENEVTEWGNILATNRPMIDLSKRVCVGGVDYANTRDFVAAGLLFLVDGVRYWLTHSWVCRQNPEYSRIKAPLEEWGKKGLLTFVDDPQISPQVLTEWFCEKREEYFILDLAIDSYRYALVKHALYEAGFDSLKDGRNNLKLVRPSDEMQIAPIITSNFVNHGYVWGDNPLMRWYTNNSKKVMNSSGNITYGKIEPKSRKTDGFKALVAAETLSSKLELYQNTSKKKKNFNKVYSY